MKTKLFLAAVLIILLPFAKTNAQVSRCGASPELVIITQPDGSKIQIKGIGDPVINYSETTDGITVVKNSSGIYEYARRDVSGTLVPSGIKAHNPDNRKKSEIEFLSTLSRHLEYSPEKISEILDQFYNTKHSKQNIGNDFDPLKPITAIFPKKGKRKILMLLIQYPDLMSKYTVSQFKDLMNKSKYNGIGSFRDYYLKNSFGQLDLDIDVVGWFTAPNGYQYYQNGANGSNMWRSQELVGQAVDSAEKAGIDFSKYDNDGDGNMDGVIVVHSGPGAEEGSQNQYIWSHRSVIPARHYDGINISNYAIQPETRNSGTRMVGIGVFCHEFGHLLGLPDFYDVYYQTEGGVGNWCLMAAGGWLNGENTPASYSAYSKIFLGWEHPTEISQDGFYMLKPSAKDSTVYLVPTPVPHEYYLLENRQYIDFDEKLNGKGMCIWRVNDSVLTGGSNWNNVNTNPNKLGYSLVQADGKHDLDTTYGKGNRGDAGDLYPGIFGKTAFDDDTRPSAKNMNGHTTGIRIFGITQLADSSIKFGFGALPQASFTATTSVCANASIAFINNSKFANSYSWNFGDGQTDTIRSPRHSFSNSGSYYVKLSVKSGSGVITSDSLKIIVNPSSVADFDVAFNGRILTINNTSKNAKFYTWYWGDGTIGYNSEPTFTRNFKDTGVYNIKLIAYASGGCNDTFMKEVHISEYYGLGISDPIMNHGKEVKIFPNPFTNEVKFSANLQNDGPVSFTITNTLGEMIGGTSVRYSKGLINIDLSKQFESVKPGIYFVKVSLNENVTILPVIKN